MKTISRNVAGAVQSCRTFSCFLVIAGAIAGPLWAADAVDEAMRKASEYLVAKQDARGAIRENDSHETAMTALSLLGLAAVGHQASEEGKHGDAFRKALGFVLKEDRQDKDGYFGSKDHSRMYGHGIVTLTLSELAGMGVDGPMNEVLRKRCQAGVDLILKSQNAKKRSGQEGGWRYVPTADDSDLSVTVWQLMALRSAKNSGFEVPGTAIERAVDYIKRSHRVGKGKAEFREPTGFGYQVGGRSVWSTATEGLLALQVCGEYQSQEVVSTADWLLDHPPKVQGTEWFFYGTYYYAQGMYQRGGNHADEAARRVAEVLLPMQEADGSWKAAGGQEGSKRVYRTAMAMLSLGVKYHFLPIYQR